MTQLNQNYQVHFSEWLQEGLDDKQVFERLTSLDMDNDTLSKIAIDYKKYRQGERSKKGFNFIVLGAILGFTSCMLTLFNVMPEFRDFFLVGLTTLGISIAVYGCYCIFE